MKKATKYIHRVVKEWPFLVHRMRKALRLVTVSMRKKQEGKRFQVTMLYYGQRVWPRQRQLLNAAWNRCIPFFTWYFPPGIGHGGLPEHFPRLQKRKKFSVFLSKIKKLRKDSLHIVGSRLFLFTGQEHCKQSSGSAVQVENSFSLVRTSQLLPWVISSCHILIFLFSLSFRTSIALGISAAQMNYTQPFPGERCF